MADRVVLILPWVFIIGLMVYSRNRITKQMGGGMGSLFTVGKSRARRFMKSASNVTFDDVAGLEHSKAMMSFPRVFCAG
ncbi:hypothetical protein JW960_11485 [candidate division KSB1 bacterium]|nr:hypothetical protein [candidate division KSB1 bacterium]